MATHTFKVNGQQIIFGLDWMSLSGEAKESKEAAALARENAAAYQVRYAGERAVVYGFLPIDSVPEKVRKPVFVSAAALLATIPDMASSAIFIEVGAQQAKLVILENGVPSPGGDFFGPVSEAEEIIHRVQQDAGENFAFYGNYTEVYSHSIPMSLEELVADGDVAAATLVKAKLGIDTRLLGMMAFTVLLLVAYFAYGYHKEQKAAQLLAEQRAKPKLDPERQYKEAILKALPNVGVPASKAVKAFMGSWGSQEILVGGWALTNVECVPQGCQYQWGIVGGDNKSLRDALGNLPYQFNVDGTGVKYSVPNNKTDLGPPNFDQLPKMADFQLVTGSLMQNLRLIGVTVSMEQITLFGADPSINVKALKSPIYFGKLTISGKLGLLEEIFSRLPDNTTVRRMTIKFENGEPTFLIEGNYYVKE